MKSSPHTARALLLALPMTLLTATAAFAQSGAASDLQRVEVSGRKLPEVTRLDVRAACPGVDKALLESLEMVSYREGSPGTVRVQFQLKGNEITAVNTKGGPVAYRMPLRRAVRMLDCGDSSDKEQVFSFAVRFNAVDEQNKNYRVALLTETSAD